MSTDQGSLRKIRKDIIANTLQLDSGKVEGDNSPNNPTNNFSATVDPTLTNDSTEGYNVGSRWVNTISGNVFTCVDATEGAAVWSLGGGGSGETFTTINAVSGSNSVNNIPAAGNYLIEKADGNPANANAVLNFIPNDGDILKLVFKSTTTGGYLLNIGTIYQISATGTHPDLFLNTEGRVAIIQYFGSAWYPLNSRFTTQM